MLATAKRMSNTMALNIDLISNLLVCITCDYWLCKHYMHIGTSTNIHFDSWMSANHSHSSYLVAAFFTVILKPMLEPTHQEKCKCSSNITQWPTLPTLHMVTMSTIHTEQDLFQVSCCGVPNSANPSTLPPSPYSGPSDGRGHHGPWGQAILLFQMSKSRLGQFSGNRQ